MDLINRFKFTRLLSEDTTSKSLHLLGTILDEASNKEELAIISVEKLAFESHQFGDLFTKFISQIDLIDNNDIFYWLKGNTNASNFKDVKVNLVYPATEKLILKYSTQNTFMIEESYSLYEKVVEPVILSTPKETTNWVDNILAGVSEADKVIYNDQNPETGFILLPDMKWDQSNLSTLYLQVLVRPTIHSIRDLNDAHLPLLNNINHWVPKIVLEKYGVDPSQIRMFFHYQPTYYRLHVHITHIQFNSLKGMTVGQAHLLSTVIDNITNIDKNYYQKCTLHYALGDNHPIYRAIQEQKQ